VIAGLLLAAPPRPVSRSFGEEARMEVRRVPNQTGGTLREFYAGYTTGPRSRAEEIGRRMLALLDRLAAAGPPLWGLTSHAALHLFTDPDGPTALVHGHGPGYVVEASGPGAEGGGSAEDAGGAVELVLAVLMPPGTRSSASGSDAESQVRRGRRD
jgi:hypothetical protein